MGIFIVAFVVLVVCIWLLFAIRKNTIDQKEKDLADGIYARAILSHIAGLPVAEGTKCMILAYEDRISITTVGAEFDLAKSKIVDMRVNTETEIQKSYVSSAGGAVGGAILFGAVGALIGGRVKQKVDTTEHKYLIITYKKDESLEYIGFDCTDTDSLLDTYNLISDYQKTATYESVKIEL